MGVPRPTMTDDEPAVFLTDLAEYLGRSSTEVLTKKARRVGMRIFKARREGSGKAALAVTRSDAKRLMESDTKAVTTIRPDELTGGDR